MSNFRSHPSRKRVMMTGNKESKISKHGFSGVWLIIMGL